MKDILTRNYHTAYPQLVESGLLTEDIIETQREYYARNKAHFAQGHEESTRTISLGGSEFRAVALRGESDETIVIGGEYGNANSIQAYTRAMGIRAVLGPEASLVLLPNNTLGENNLNFSPLERSMVHEGVAKPYVDRYKKALAHIGAEDQAVHIVGMSLGATTGAALAADKDVRARSLAMIEPPYLEGSTLKSAIDFGQSGAQLGRNIEISQQGMEEFDALKLDGPLGFARFGIGSMTPSNLASLSFMKHHDTKEDIQQVAYSPRNIGFVSAWGTEARVSPVTTNRVIAASYAGHPRGEFVEIQGADHSVTNAHAVVAALANRAKSLNAR